MGKPKNDDDDVKIGDAADKKAVTDRSGEVFSNKTAREAQIAKADAAMEKLNDANSEHGAALAKAAEDEEAKYANHGDLPPATGKAFNTVTPVLDRHGNKHWGGPVTG